MQTLAQHRLLLALIECLARALIDLARHLEHLDAPIQEREHAVQARLQVEGREELLFLLGFQVHEAGHHVRQGRGRLDGADGIAQLGGRLRQELHGLAGALAQRQGARLDIPADDRGFAMRLDARHEERLAARIVEHREALLALRDQMMRAVRPGDEAHDGGDRSDGMQVSRARDPPRTPTVGPTPRGAACAPPPGPPPAHACRGPRWAARPPETARYRGDGQNDEHILGEGRGGRRGIHRSGVHVHSEDPVKRRYR